jgi:hypothetical protein
MRDMNSCGFIFSAVLIANPESSPGIDPADGSPGAGDSAAAAFQAALVGEGHVIFPHYIAFRRASVETGLQITTLALRLLQGDVDLPIDIKFIEGQFLFYFQTAFLAFQASERISPRERFPFILSLMVE